MTGLRAFFDRLLGGHRPPTGPLTTDEEHEADALRQRTLSDSSRIEQEAEEESRGTEQAPTDHSV